MQSGQYNFSTLSKKGKRSTHENHLLKGVVSWRFLNSRASALDGAAELPGEPHATVPPHPDTVASPPLYLHRSSGLKYNTCIHGGCMYLPHRLRKQCHFVELAAAHTKVADVQTRRRQRRRPRVDPPEAVLARPGVRTTAARHDRHGPDGTTCTCSTDDEANMADKDQINRPPVLFNGNELWRRIRHPVSMRVLLGLHAG